MKLPDWEGELETEGAESKVEDDACTNREKGDLEGACGAEQSGVRERARVPSLTHFV